MTEETTHIAGCKYTFGEQYISLRKREGRLLTDQEVASLPDIAATHELKKEWVVRKASCVRLMNHLSKKETSLDILEIGCGNGWLSNQLSKIKDARVTGLDINAFELEQAARVFGKQANLNFVLGDLGRDTFAGRTFDVIVFAASIQYFPSLAQIISLALEHLKRDGEIHILDTHFYKSNQIKEARERSSRYFSRLGCKEMNDFYFHHALEGLTDYKYRFLFDPNKAVNKLFRKNYPFHWICIQHP